MKRRRRIGSISLLLIASAAAAPASAEIRYDPASRIFRLTGGGAEYDIRIDDQGYLRPAYWGRTLDAAAPVALPLLPPPPVIGAMDPPSSVTAQSMPDRVAAS